MDKNTLETVLAKIAKEEQMTEAVVYERMQDAIIRSINQEDELVKKNWGEIPCDGCCPTLEELIDYIDSKLK